VEWTTSEWPTHFGESPIPFLPLLFNYYKQAFKHIFTSSSSVDQELKATQSRNAHIHGMQRVTKASIAYVATQVCMFLRGLLLALNGNRPAFPSPLCRYFLVQTFSPTPSVSIPALSNSLMKRMKRMKWINYWCGGTGMCHIFSCKYWVSVLIVYSDKYSLFILNLSVFPRRIVSLHRLNRSAGKSERVL